MTDDQTETTVTHPLEDIRRGAALAGCLRPDTAEIVDADVTEDDELALTLRGDEL